MSFGSFSTKATGVCALYLSLKDSHRIGIACKNKSPKAYIANTYPDRFVKSQRLNMSSTMLPTIVSDVHRGYYNYFLSDSFFPFIHGITGYVKGIFNGFYNNVIAIGLGIGALASKRFGKYCAIGLGLAAAKTMLFDVMGVGDYKRL